MYSKLTRKKILPIILIISIYISLYLYINSSVFENSSFPYYSYLLDSVLKGKLDIYPFSTIDLSFFNGKWYLNWGPGAIVYVLIFKLIFQNNLSDKLYTVIAGLLNVLLFSLFLEEFRKYFKLHLSDLSKIFIILSFALASPNLYLALSGRIWFTEQIVAVLYLLISLLTLFKFLNLKKLRYFVVSVVFINLAWLTRAPIIFHGLLLIVVMFEFKKSEMFKKMFLCAFAITIISLLLFFSYNFARFNNILETGLHFHNGNPRYETFLQKGQLFSIDYIYNNFYYFFINTPFFSSKRPYFSLNLEGNSIFIFYPLMLLYFFFFKKYFEIFKNEIYFRLFITIFFLEIILLLCYFATGWTQVGMRYFLDLVPISFVSLAFIADRVKVPFKIILVFLGGTLNILGALIFFNKFG